ncbi:MAG: hypothetical protein ABSE73_24160 [Planctomycetota bacterium]
MRLLTAVRTIRVCALALWLGSGLAMLIAIPIIIRQHPNDELRACEIANWLILDAGRIRLALALFTLGCQAILFYSRSPAAPTGWRRLTSTLLVMAALAAVLAVQQYLGLRVVMSAALGSGAAHSGHLVLSQRGMILLVLEAILVAAALIISVKQPEPGISSPVR